MMGKKKVFVLCDEVRQFDDLLLQVFFFPTNKRQKKTKVLLWRLLVGAGCLLVEVDWSPDPQRVILSTCWGWSWENPPWSSKTGAVAISSRPLLRHALMRMDDPTGWISEGASPLWSRDYDGSCQDSERLFRWLGVEKMIMGHTPVDTSEHGKVHEMCAGRGVIADVAMSRGYRAGFAKAKIAVVEMDSENSAAGTVFYEDIKSPGARSSAVRSSGSPLFAPRESSHE